MQIKENNKFTGLSAVLLLLLLASWAAGYAWLPMYFDMCDEPYQIMCGWDYRSSVVAPLSAWLTSAVGALWNYDFLSFRVMGWTLQSVAVFIAMLPVWWQSRNINFTLGAGAVSTFLFSMFRQIEWMFNWDSYAVPVLMVVVVLCFSYLRKPSVWKTAAMGAACGVLAMLRLPSAAAIVIPAMCILLGAGRAKAPKLAILLAVYTISGLVILLALYGSVGQYLAMLEDNLISAHSSTGLYNLYAGQLPMLYLYGLGAAGIFFLVGKSRLDAMDARRAVVLALVIGGVSYLFLRGIEAECKWIYFSPIYIVTEAYLVWKMRGKMRLGAAIALMATIFGGLGSNIMVVRAVIYPTMPIVLYYLALVINDKAKAVAFASVWIPMMLVAFKDTLQMFEFQARCPEQPAPHELQGVPHMRGAWVGWWELDRLQRMADRFMPFVNDTTYNTAVMRNIPDDYFFEYIFDSRSPVYSHYWDGDTLMLNKDYTDRFTRWVESSRRPVAVLMVRFVKTTTLPEESIIREYKARYNTVYSDSDFTIVTLPAQITSMSESRR